MFFIFRSGKTQISVINLTHVKIITIDDILDEHDPNFGKELVTVDGEDEFIMSEHCVEDLLNVMHRVIENNKIFGA